MATGDSNDLLSRLPRVIPWGWWQVLPPIRNAVLGGINDAAAWCYSLIGYTAQQARLATMSGIFLDLFAYDFFGRYLLRGGAVDAIFRASIQATLFKERVTRAGMYNALLALTGYAPKIIEPWSTGDCGAYSGPSRTIGNIGYGVAGCWGSMNLPGQVFLTAYVGSSSNGIPGVAGYGSPIGGYGIGAVAYSPPAAEGYGTTDQQVLATINATKPTGVTVWTQIQSPTNTQPSDNQPGGVP